LHQCHRDSDAAWVCAFSPLPKGFPFRIFAKQRIEFLSSLLITVSPCCTGDGGRGIHGQASLEGMGRVTTHRGRRYLQYLHSTSCFPHLHAAISLVQLSFPQIGLLSTHPPRFGFNMLAWVFIHSPCES